MTGPDPPAGYAFGSFRLEPRERRLTCDGKAVTLQPKVFDTLVLLVENAGHLMTKERLMAALWPDAVVEESNLTKNIWSIRKALGDAEGGGLFVDTVPRIGYRFVADVRAAPLEAAHSERPAEEPVPIPETPVVAGAGAQAPPAEPAPPPTPPRRLGPYEIVAELGSGGMGQVYRARDRRLERDVAVKVLPESFALDPERMRRFQMEAQSAGALNHPAITAVYDFGVHAGSPYIVTELLEGQTLRDHLAAGPLPPRRAVDFAIQIAEGLAVAHERGVVHRDLKPDNLFVTRGGRVKILDFGLAKRTDLSGGGPTDASDTRADTEPGAVLGTTGYMSPEQVRGEPADARSDLFSLGAVLYEMLTGRRAFHRETPAETMTAVLRDEPPALSAAGIPAQPELERVLDHCLEKNPDQRFQSARDLIFDLTAIGGGTGAASDRARGVAPVPGPPRLPRLAASFGIAGIVLIAAAALIFLARRHPTPAKPSPGAHPGAPLRKSIAVLGLANLSGRHEADWLSTALAAMVTAELSAGEQMRIVPAENVARRRLTPAPGALSAETLQTMRNDLDADEVALGSYVAIAAPGGEQIRLDVLVQDTASGETLAAVSETGTESDLFRLVSAAGQDLRLKLGLSGRTAAEAEAVRAALPRDPAATRIYAEGLDHLRRGEASAARDLLMRATAMEPGFALAHAALSEAWSTLGYDARAEEEARKAVEHSEGLSREERLGVQAQLAQARKKWDEAIQLYQALWTWFPDDIEYGLRAARMQIAAGRANTALQTVVLLRKSPGIQAEDPRIDLAEAAAAAALSDHRRQMAAATRAVDKAHRLGTKMILAQARLEEGSAMQDLGDYAGPQPKYEEARSLYRAVGDRAGEAAVLRSLGGLELSRGELSGARALYAQALDISKSLGHRGGEAASLTDMINLDWLQAGDLSLVGRELERLRALYEEVADRSGTAWALNGIGTVAWDQGDLARAMDLHRQALAISRAIGKPDWEAWSLECIGDVSHSAGNLQSSRESYEQALSIYVRLKDEGARARILNDLSGFFFDIGDVAQARADAQEAMAIETKLGDLDTRAQTALSLADALTASGQPEEAARLAREAGAHFQQQRENGNTALAQGTLVRALLALGRSRDAKDISDQARSLLEDTKVNEILPARLAFARADAAAGLVAPARKEMERVLQKADRIGWVNFQLDARLALAQLDLDSGQSARGRAELASLARDAKTSGFGRFASEAARLLGETPAH